MEFYAMALTNKGETKLITNLGGNQLTATNDAKATCRKQGLNFQYVLPVKGTAYAGTSQHKSLFKRIAAERSKK